MRATWIPRRTSLPAILDKLKHGLKAAANGTADTDGAATAAPSAPAPAAAGDADAQQQGALPQSITVGKGESLWDIAARVYGNAELYQRIYDANRDRIRDPDRIFPGMTLNLPAAESN